MRRSAVLDTISSPVEPRGSRPPHPGRLGTLLRLVWTGSVILGGGPAALAWLARRSPVMPGTVPDVALLVVERLQASGLHRPFAGSAIILTALALAEMVVQVCLRLAHRQMLLARAGHVEQRLVYRVRVPRAVPTPGQQSSLMPSHDLFRAIAAAIPARGQRLGCAPAVAFMLVGEPDQPTALQYGISGGTAAQRARLAENLRATILGQRPAALVELISDPLLATIVTSAAPRSIVWRTFRLALPPHYPLRFGDDAGHTDLLGPVVTALQPGAGVAMTELQLVLQPVRGIAASLLHRGWRGHATALRLRLQHRQEYALSDDAAALEQKLAGAPFYATVRVVAVGPDVQAAERAIERITDTLGAYQSRTSHLVQHWVAGQRKCVQLPPRASSAPIVDRRLARLLARAPHPVPPPCLLLPVRLFPCPDILSSAELTALWHLPTPLLGDLVRHLPSRLLAAPPAAFITGDDPERIVVGHAQRSDGRWQPVGPTLHDLREILHVIAGQGAGKTRLVVNMVEQSLRSGCTLMNGKGDDVGGASAAVQQLIPLAEEARLILWNPLDAAWPISFNPLAAVDLDGPAMEDMILGQVQAVFNRIDADGMRHGPVMQMLLDMATLLVLGGGGAPSRRPHPASGRVGCPTLAHIEQALADPGYRARLLPLIVNPTVRAYWEARRDGYSEREQQSVEALGRRFHKLLTSELVRSLLVQPRPLFDFGRAIDERSIVLIDLPHNRLGGLTGVIGMLLFGAFIRAALQRAGDARSRQNYPLYIDEVQVFLEHSDGSDFALALSQLRGFGIPTAYFHQALAQLGPYREIMQVNAGSRIIMRTKYPDSAALAHEYGAWGLTETDISALDPAEHQYAVLRVNGTQCGPLSMRPLPWPAPHNAKLSGACTVGSWQSVIRRMTTARRARLAARARRIPPDSPCPEVDREVIRLVYGRHDEQAVIGRFADRQQLPDSDWALILDRWNAIRQWQRQRLLAEPALVPDRCIRQRWLSRLLVAHPRVLARIDDARTWQSRTSTTARRSRPSAPYVLRSSPRSPSRPPGSIPQDHHGRTTTQQPALAAIDGERCVDAPDAGDVP